MNSNLIIDGYPVTPRNLLRETPAHVAREVARTPALKRVCDATVRLAKAKYAWCVNRLKRTTAENRRVEHKLIDGVGEKLGTVPVPLLVENAKAMGLPPNEWWRQENIEDFFHYNPQFKIKITRETKGQELRK